MIFQVWGTGNSLAGMAGGPTRCRVVMEANSMAVAMEANSTAAVCHKARVAEAVKAAWVAAISMVAVIKIVWDMAGNGD